MARGDPLLFKNPSHWIRWVVLSGVFLIHGLIDIGPNRVDFFCDMLAAPPLPSVRESAGGRLIIHIIQRENT